MLVCVTNFNLKKMTELFRGILQPKECSSKPEEPFSIKGTREETKRRIETTTNEDVSDGGIEMPQDLMKEFGLNYTEVEIDPKDRENRKRVRINRDVFLDEEILIYVSNLDIGNTSRDSLLNISAGGLLLISERNKNIGDKLVLEFRLGQDKITIKGIIRRKEGHEYGVEFINPSDAFIKKIEQTYGALKLGRHF